MSRRAVVDRPWLLWVCLGVGVASLLAWRLALGQARPNPVADERHHLPAIQRLERGEPAGDLPMPPAFHYLAVAWLRAGRASGLFDRAATEHVDLRGVRTLSTAASVGALLLFAGAVIAASRSATVLVPEERGDGSGALPAGAAARTLLLAWNPLLLPYTSLAYTEALSTLAIAAALCLHVCGRRFPGALALLAAVLIRQSNIVWALLFVAWDLLELARTWRRGGGASTARGALRSCLATSWPYLLLGAGVGVVVLFWPKLLFPSTGGNEARFNPAQLYLFGAAAAVLWAPLWIAVARAAARSILGPALAWGAACAAWVGAAGLLAMNFRNPHPWNGEPEYLQNKVLTLLDGSALFRGGVSFVLAAAAALAWLRLRRTAPRGPLVVAAAVSLVYLAPHWLVDQRYYILPSLFLDFCLPLSRREAWGLVAWRAVLTAGLCAYLLTRGASYAGL